MANGRTINERTIDRIQKEASGLAQIAVTYNDVETNVARLIKDYAIAERSRVINEAIARIQSCNTWNDGKLFANTSIEILESMRIEL